MVGGDSELRAYETVAACRGLARLGGSRLTVSDSKWIVKVRITRMLARQRGLTGDSGESGGEG